MIDESVDARIASALTAAGHDVVEVRLSAAGSADIDIAAAALDDHRIIVTADRDFGALAFRDARPMPGVIFIRMPGRPVEERLGRILSALAAFADRISTSIVVVESDKFRDRPLLRVV